ncbi:zinc-binding alcohol dehydrogenase family protein [Nitrosomonas sp. Is37]|uniref:zinc-binding alcohol dehydrogenase family protein n=1 Tax=Nitrosomonas sp. Is37 TaxID=3080535 RepID=UPI00294B2361|nr:zinc-binding alcohol dehydrogenase family protein [Nitrosomonas sp. Is37]MDV6343022.1 zinc-binding alcohol dehydrogenase family protein [Nitrosomonas sp. Is37]
MRALGINAQQTFELAELPEPIFGDYDLLVRVKAVAVNPVDTKLKASIKPDQIGLKVLGFDACGEVLAIGTRVEGFAVGDRVFYAGDVIRTGCFAEQQAVDSRLVAKAPQSLSDLEAAAMPLVGLTASEALFDHLGFSLDAASNQGKRLLIIGGAGGVGSMAIQLAKQVGIVVIVTASRAESQAWCKQLGADQVIDYSQPLRPQLVQEVDRILCTADTDSHLDNMAACIRPFGRICALVSPRQPMDMNRFKNKSVGFHWEFMFTRAMFNTPDKSQQGVYLQRLAEAVDAGVVRSILTHQGGQLSVETLQAAFEQVASGRMIGKIALKGF